jgi:integrase
VCGGAAQSATRFETGASRAVPFCRTCGVPNLTIHDLRHTRNTLAASTPGTSIRDLMERMGQDSMRAAVIYQHATRQADRRIADSLSVAINDAAINADHTMPISL